MSTGLRDHWVEALAGLAVVALAAWFFLFASERTRGAVGSESYRLTARFPNVTGVAVGTDVRVSGLKVGSVTSAALDPETFEAVVTLTVDSAVSLPSDSVAAVTSEGVLGGSFIALIPGGERTTLKPGAEIVETQGATDLMGLIGAVMNQSGGSSADGGAGAKPAARTLPEGAEPAPPPLAVEPAVEPAAP